MLQGLQNEDNIAEAFINKMDTAEGKKGVTITKCGLFVSKNHGFLGASPDGIITDPEETTPGAAEFKYRQVKLDETLTDVLLRQHICSKVQHNNAETIQLNKNHKCYFQLYQQMFVTGYHWGVFIAHCLASTHPASPRSRSPLAFHTQFFSFSGLSESLGPFSTQVYNSW